MADSGLAKIYFDAASAAILPSLPSSPSSAWLSSRHGVKTTHIGRLVSSHKAWEVGRHRDTGRIDIAMHNTVPRKR
jgi:hypothetical protein